MEFKWAECDFIDLVESKMGYSTGFAMFIFDAIVDELGEDFVHYNGGHKYFHVEMDKEYFDMKIQNIDKLLAECLEKYVAECQNNGQTVDAVEITNILLTIGNFDSMKFYNTLNTSLEDWGYWDNRKKEKTK